MKTIFFFTDVETTGLYQVEDQVLTYAMIFTEKDKTLFEKEVKIKLKNNVFPNSEALILNNVNPYDPVHLKESLTENEAAHFFIEKIHEFKKQGFRVVFVAYNAAFDSGMLGNMCKRNGIDLNSIIDSTFDPLIMAKNMIQSGTLKTLEIESKYGAKRYNSSKLEHVYNALGYSSSEITTHNALEDTKMLKTVVFKLYYLFTGKPFDEINVDLNDFQEGEIKTVVFEEDMEFKIKTFKVLKINQDPEKQGMFVLDFDEIGKENVQIKNFVKIIDPNKIIDDLDLKVKESEKLEEFFLQNQYSINEYLNKHHFPQNTKRSSFEIPGFEKIIEIAEKKIKNPDLTLDKDEQPLENEAENFCYAKYNKGWIKKDNNVYKSLKIDDYYSIELNYAGYYELKNETKSIFNSDKKTEFLEKLVIEQLITKGSDLYKQINSFLEPVKSFKNVKHPSLLIKEFNEKKTLIFNGSNKHHKETMKNLLEHYKKNNNEAYKDLTIPEFKMNLNLFKK